VALGIGHNGIGRGPDQKARVNFGDDTISREAHAIATFDPKSGKFYLMHGGQGRNLVYLNKSPVLQFSGLNTGDEIELGNTVLRFCAFCTEQFKWDEA
jgi:pSer/pThr/pTyr-binding forkhead associated (FHA) protein